MTKASEQAAREVCPNAPLDLGIALIVQTMRAAGVNTFESCDGSEGHAYPDPTVRLHGTPAEGWRALAVCQDHRFPIREIARVWDMNNGEPCGPYWQIVFRRPGD